MKRIVAAIALVVLTALLFTACKSEKALIGKWENTEKNMAFEFKEDGSGVYTSIVNDEKVSEDFEWSVEGDTLCVSLLIDAENQEIRIKGKTLTLIQDGEETVFNKAQ